LDISQRFVERCFFIR